MKGEKFICKGALCLVLCDPVYAQDIENCTTSSASLIVALEVIDPMSSDWPIGQIIERNVTDLKRYEIEKNDSKKVQV